MLTDEQLKIRSKGIGGSEVAAVCGLNPYMRPIDVYLTKIGAAEFEETFHTERGTFIEEGLIKWYAHRYKRAKIDFPGTLIHADHPLVIATPDAVADDKCVVEIKAPHWRTADQWGEPESDEIPDYYLPQTQWEMAVTGKKQADVVAFIDGNIQRHQVLFSQRLFEALLEQAERFWRNHVVARKPPPEDGSDSYSEFLAKQFPRSDEKKIESNDAEVVQLVKRYSHAKKAEEAAFEAKSKARQSLEKIIGNHAGICGAWGSISFKHNRDSVVTDYKALCSSLKPTAAAIAKFQTTKHGPRVFRATIKKE